MATSVFELLTIQKFIFLLDDFHYHEFVSYLESSKATLSLKLAGAIKEKLPGFDTHENLCRNVYGRADKSSRANFNQLSAHTFKLSAYLAQNYPGYLTHNISRLQKWANDGKKEETLLLTDALLDIASRTEDFNSQKAVLQFLSEQANINKITSSSLKLAAQLQNVADTEYTYIKIQTTLRKNLYSEATLSEAELKKWKSYYGQFHNHASPSVRIISRFASLSCTYHFSPELFREPDVECIKALDKDLAQYNYLTLPFMSDIKGNFGFIKLNSPVIHPNSKEGKKLFAGLSLYYQSLKFPKNYLSTGELYLTTIAGTRLLTIYHPLIHRPDYALLLDEADRLQLEGLTKKCEDWLQHLTPVDNPFQYKGVKMLYGVFLILTGGKEIQRGIDELEMLLTTFQQVNLKGSTDSIFMCLITGYFSVKNYQKCAWVFSRFLKSSKGKPVFEGNVVKIYSYYYISQWVATGSKQYAAKLHKLLYKDISTEPPPTILELAKYFGVFSKLK